MVSNEKAISKNNFVNASGDLKSNMTSRELVKAALEFASPQRIPRQLWFLPWASARYPNEPAPNPTKFS
jgi:hypothetical protein